MIKSDILRCNITFPKATIELLEKGSLWLVKEADEFFDDTANVIAIAYQDTAETVAKVFSDQNLKKTVNSIRDGTIEGLENLGDDILAVAAFMESTFSPEALLDNFDDMVNLVGNVGKEMVDDAAKVVHQAESELRGALIQIEDIGGPAVRWLKTEIAAVGDDICAAVTRTFEDLANQIEGFIQDIGTFLEKGIDDVMNEIEGVWEDACREDESVHSNTNVIDTEHTGCPIYEFKIHSRLKNHFPCCNWCARGWRTEYSRKYIHESCVEDHLKKVKIEKSKHC